MTCQLGSFNYQSNIPSWNICCVLRSRLKLVSRERKMMLMLSIRWCWGGGCWGGRPMRPERRHTLCASLRSRNALQHVTRAAPYGNLQVTRRRPEWGAPRSGTCLYTYRRGIKRQTATACKRATSGLLDFWTCRWPGHTGTRAQPDPRARGHTGTTPIHGHTGKGHQSTALSPCSHPRRVFMHMYWNCFTISYPNFSFLNISYLIPKVSI